MIKLTTKGRAPRLYDCFGEKITAKEGADRLGISIHTMRNRLQLYGDNMEEVMHYYQNQQEKRSGAKMKKLTENEERAVQDIAHMLCGGGNTVSTGEHDAENPEDALHKINAAEDSSDDVRAEPEPAAAPEAADDPERQQLRAVNRAIDALERLDGELVGAAFHGRLLDDAMDLKALRREKFDHLVDWRALAVK